jgi:hypothetical protein
MPDFEKVTLDLTRKASFSLFEEVISKLTEF